MILNETAVICLSQSTEYKGNKSSFYALTCALIPFHSFVIAMFYTWCSELVYFPINVGTVLRIAEELMIDDSPFINIV